VGAGVVAQHRHLQPADAGGPCPRAETGDQRGAHATALPPVDDLDGHLCGIEVVQAHVAGDPDRRPRRRREGDQRLMVPVVDVEQDAQLARGQVGLRGEVALVAGARAEPAEGEGDRAPVGRAKLADRDLIPHT
jgi:hypothetical protein